MDPGDAVPPPFRRSSRDASQLHEHVQSSWLNDDLDDSDDAAPPPIARQRSSSIPPVPNKSPLRLLPEPSDSPAAPLTRNFSHPFKNRFRNATQHAAPARNALRPLSYRNNPRLPLSLRRWSSLETIDSVATTPSLQDEGSQRADSPSTSFSTLEEEASSSLSDSRRSDGPPSLTSDETNSLRSTATLARPDHAHHNSASSSVIRKLKRPKVQEPLILPEHLEIEKTVSFDQTSHRSHSSSSILTISSGRPSELGYPASSTASKRSQDSTDWKASEYDISILSEKELKKCKKRGINPALYAEMKAARKGKWVSPIGGNTIL